MTTEQPTRLALEDAEFASLVAASNREEPPAEHIEKALSLADQITVRSRWTSRRGLGANIAVGLAVIGATALGVVAGTRALRSGAAPAPYVAAPAVGLQPCSGTPCAPDAEDEAKRPPSTDEEGSPVVTVSVNDLAPVPPEAVPPATGRPLPNAAGPATAGSPAAPATAANAASPPPENAQPGSSGSAPGMARTTFAEELALVGAARSALERGDVPSCVRAVDRYQERFGSGTFAHEIEVIRIEALFASGERTRARAAAEQFVRANANSPYVDRVRSLLERSNH